MSVYKQYDQKRFIGFQGDSKKHSNSHQTSLSQNSDDQRWHSVSESHNSKKKHLLQQHQVNLSGVQNTGANQSKTHQHTSSLIGEIIPQQATDQAKKEKRNKDRLSHLSKLLPQKARWIGYLDVGCGNAEISVTIAQSLGIGNVYGVDMFDEDDFVQPSMDLEVKYLQNLNNKLNLPSNCVDLVTCFMAIHHFEQLDLMLREIQRVLTIEGYLFIREHDVPFKNKKLRTYIEEQHRKYPDHPADGYMMLYDREELKDILFAYGFEHLGDSNYTGQNLQAVYHSLYILKRKEVNSNFKQLINKNRKDLKNNESFNEEQEDTEGKSSSNNFSSRGSINSSGQQEGEDVLYFNSLSLSNGKRKSSQEFNRRDMHEQYDQIVLQQNSDSVNSEQEKDSSPAEILSKNQQLLQQQKTPLKQSNTSKVEKQPTTQEKTKIQNQKKINLYPDWDIEQDTQNKKIQEEHVDVYANIISVPQSKKDQTNSLAQKQQNQQKQQYQQKKEQISNDEVQPQADKIIEESPLPQKKESQKINAFDDDGFMIVGAKDKAKKQQPKNNCQAPQQATNQNGKGQSQPQNITDNQNNKKAKIQAREEEKNKMISEQSLVEEQKNGEQESAVQDDESNQFIYIKSKKQLKKKSKK